MTKIMAAMLVSLTKEVNTNIAAMTSSTNAFFSGNILKLYLVGVIQRQCSKPSLKHLNLHLVRKISVNFLSGKYP